MIHDMDERGSKLAEAIALKQANQLGEWFMQVYAFCVEQQSADVHPSSKIHRVVNELFWKSVDDQLKELSYADLHGSLFSDPIVTAEDCSLLSKFLKVKLHPSANEKTLTAFLVYGELEFLSHVKEFESNTKRAQKKRRLMKATTSIIADEDE